MKLELFIFGFGLFISYSEGSVTISVPSAGNCGEDTVLTCHVTGSIAFTGWYGLDRSLVTNGSPVRPEDSNKYTETRGTSSFTLTIHNTDVTDEGTYRCKNGFQESQLTRLNIECKASAAVLTVTSGKKVVLSIDKLYPASPSLTASFNNQNSAVTVPGSRTCSSSRQYPGYYKCVWTSSNSLADGSYTYSLVVTTITQADPLTGSLKIVSPQTPVISNVVKLEDNREVVYGNEDQSLTIQCTSIGGFPAPTVVWYKDSISSSNQMTSTVKPSQPTVTQTAVVSAGDTVEISCRTAGNRPAANISWSYEGSTTQVEVTATLDSDTETYTVVSVFRKQVAAKDNGRNVQCVVTHTTLVSPSELAASVKLNIRFGPSSTHITGNKEMIATGQTALKLTCTTGSSNPASDITWTNGSVTLTNSRPYTSSAGENNGVVRSQQLVFYPTRYMDGDVITCSVSNIVSQSDVEDSITLDLKYRPLVQLMSEVIAVEGNNTVLTCTACSKPASTFKWYRVGQSSIVSQGTGTLESNQWSYTINNVRRTDAATYRCNANNGIETPDNGNVLLTVYHPPDVTAVATNTTVKADTALMTCHAKGVPDNNYKYGKWTQLWPGYNIPVSERLGNDRLELTDLTYEHSGVYTCSASNGIKVFGTNKEFMKGSVLLVVKSFPIITKVREKTPARLKENATVEVQYYSNTAGSDVKIYRNVNARRLAGVTYAVSESGEVVDLPVFTHIVRTGGTRARIMIQIQSIEDYGLYDVVVSNEIDSSTRFFEVVPKGPPSKPLDVRVDIIQYNSARLSWIRGYHGGFAQTFVIQLSTDKKNWKDVTVHGGKDESREPLAHVLSALLDSTTYYVRMYAMNKEGNSPFTENLNYSTPSIIEKECVHTSDRSALIVGIVLGLVIVAVVTYAIYITILLKRRHVYIQKEGISEQTSKQMYVNMPVSAKGGASIMKKTTRGINTFTDETASENQYTELDKTLREQDSAYEAISSM